MQRQSKKIIYIILLMFFCSASVAAQRILVHEETDTSGAPLMFGKNRTIFVHGLSKFGLVVPPYEEGAKTNWWSSVYSSEIRTKAKICSWNALVIDFGYRCDRYVINQTQNKLLPIGTISHKKERLSMHTISFALCDRINFGRRGNILGTYLDFGFYGDYVFRAAHLQVDQFYDSNSPYAIQVKSRTKSTQLQYINRLNYGLTARIGFEYWSIFGMYRMTDLIRDNPPFFYYPDLPKLSLGVEVYMIEE